MTPTLQKLQATAEAANISLNVCIDIICVNISLCNGYYNDILQVIGLGRPYLGYTQKIEWYHEAISSNHSNVNDNDVVVMMDAYDVLLSLPIRTIANV
jgi:aspartate ammonia-lyase